MGTFDIYALYYCKRMKRPIRRIEEFLSYYDLEIDIWSEILDDAEKRGIKITRLSTEELDENNILYYLNEDKTEFYKLRINDGKLILS